MPEIRMDLSTKRYRNHRQKQQYKCRYRNIPHELIITIIINIYSIIIRIEMLKEYDYLFKIVIIGNSSVGKSSLLVRYTVNPKSNVRMTSLMKLI